MAADDYHPSTTMAPNLATCMAGSAADPNNIRIFGELVNNYIQGTPGRSPQIQWPPAYQLAVKRHLARRNHTLKTLNYIKKSPDHPTHNDELRDLAETLGIRSRDLSLSQWFGVRGKIWASLFHHLRIFVKEYGVLQPDQWDPETGRVVCRGWKKAPRDAVLADDFTGKLTRTFHSAVEDVVLVEEEREQGNDQQGFKQEGDGGANLPRQDEEGWDEAEDEEMTDAPDLSDQGQSQPFGPCDHQGPPSEHHFSQGQGQGGVSISPQPSSTIPSPTAHMHTAQMMLHQEEVNHGHIEVSFDLPPRRWGMAQSTPTPSPITQHYSSPNPQYHTQAHESIPVQVRESAPSPSPSPPPVPMKIPVQASAQSPVYITPGIVQASVATNRQLPVHRARVGKYSASVITSSSSSSSATTSLRPNTQAIPLKPEVEASNRGFAQSQHASSLGGHPAVSPPPTVLEKRLHASISPMLHPPPQPRHSRYRDHHDLSVMPSSRNSEQQWHPPSSSQLPSQRQTPLPTSDVLIPRPSSGLNNLSRPPLSPPLPAPDHGADEFSLHVPASQQVTRPYNSIFSRLPPVNSSAAPLEVVRDQLPRSLPVPSQLSNLMSASVLPHPTPPATQSIVAAASSSYPHLRRRQGAAIVNAIPGVDMDPYSKTKKDAFLAERKARRDQVHGAIRAEEANPAITSSSLPSVSPPPLPRPPPPPPSSSPSALMQRDGDIIITRESYQSTFPCPATVSQFRSRVSGSISSNNRGIKTPNGGKTLRPRLSPEEMRLLPSTEDDHHPRHFEQENVRPQLALEDEPHRPVLRPFTASAHADPTTSPSSLPQELTSKTQSWPFARVPRFPAQPHPQTSSSATPPNMSHETTTRQEASNTTQAQELLHKLIDARFDQLTLHARILASAKSIYQKTRSEDRIRAWQQMQNKWMPTTRDAEVFVHNAQIAVLQSVEARRMMYMKHVIETDRETTRTVGEQWRYFDQSSVASANTRNTNTGPEDEEYKNEDEDEDDDEDDEDEDEEWRGEVEEAILGDRRLFSVFGRIVTRRYYWEN